MSKFCEKKIKKLKLAFFLLSVSGTVGMSPPKDMNKKKGEMLKHFQEHVHNKFNRYAFGFFLCEFCNLLFAVICIYLTHIFLNYQFYDYGILVYQ